MNDREEETSRGFKVEDRRRFSAEGELKPEHRAAAEPPEPAPVGSPPQAQPPASSEEGGEISFAAFIMSLSTQALMHLGEIADPVTNTLQRDLPAAQHMIDLIGMLQEKTRGNLDADEEGLLRSMLYDLRMKYVETARHPQR